MRPSSSLTTQRPDLADAYTEYDILAQERGYVGLKLLPALDVTVQAGTFGVLPLEEIKRKMADVDLRRAVNGGYTKTDWKFETDTFTTKEYGIEIPIDDREASMYANYMDGAMVSSQIARLSLLDAFEARVATAVINGATTTAAATTAWTTFASAVPVTDIFTGIKSVWDRSGHMPDTLALSWKDFFHLKMCSQFQDFFKYTTNSAPENISAQQVAQALGLRQILISGVNTNTAAEDTAASMSAVWTAGVAILAKCASGPGDSIKSPQIGRTFHWIGDGSRVDGAPEEYYDESRRSRIMRVRHDVHEKLTTNAATLMYKITGASS